MTHLLLHKTPNSVSSEPGAAHSNRQRTFAVRLQQFDDSLGNRFAIQEINFGFIIRDQHCSNPIPRVTPDDAEVILFVE
jgi:hypothetical protein